MTTNCRLEFVVFFGQKWNSSFFGQNQVSQWNIKPQSNRHAEKKNLTRLSLLVNLISASCKEQKFWKSSAGSNFRRHIVMIKTGFIENNKQSHTHTRADNGYQHYATILSSLRWLYVLYLKHEQEFLMSYKTKCAKREWLCTK